ncbi:MAG: hypothetical protein Q8M16_10980 [Pirellulaceae bacterium]|nr:hypothetical protein [Pirellulaceae bacterium]
MKQVSFAVLWLALSWLGGGSSPVTNAFLGSVQEEAVPATASPSEASTPVVLDTPPERSNQDDGTVPQELNFTADSTSQVPGTVPNDDPKKFELPGWAVEQSIYIPYQRIRDKFEQTGRGVYIPYEQFEELWNAARESKKATEAPAIPTSFALVSSLSRATLERTLVRVETDILIDFVQAGWHRVPLGLNGCAIQSAELNEEPCRVVQREDGGFELLYEAKSANLAGRLAMQYVTGVTVGGGENKVSWPVPPTAINRWEIVIDQPEVDIMVTPAVVTSTTNRSTPTDSPAETPVVETDPNRSVDKNRSSIVALLGNSQQIEVRWTPRSVGAEGLAALVTAQTQVQADVQRNLIRSRHNLTLQIQRAAINNVELSVPRELRIVNVLSESVKKWQVDAEQGLLKIDLFEGLQGALSLIVETEQEIAGDTTSKRQIALTPIQVAAATRQPGTLIVLGEPGLRIDVAKLTGLSRVNDGRPHEPDAGPARLNFQYSTVPYELTLDLEEWAPLVHAQQRVHAQLESRRVETTTRFLLDVKQRGIFQIPLDLPEGLEIVRVIGDSPAGHQGVSIEKHERVAEPAGRVMVQLAAEARGPVAFLVTTTQSIPGAGLVDAEAAPTPITIRWPQLAPTFAQSIKGHVVLTAPDRLNVVVEGTNQGNLRSIDPATAFASSDSASQRFAYEYVVATGSFDLKASLRRPRVFVDQVTSVSVESGLLRYQVDLDYDVRFSAVADFRVDVPSASENRIRVVGGTLNQQKIEPQPADVAPGFVAWKLVGPSELLGKHSVQLTWDVTVPEIAVGATKSFDIATAVAKNVERERGQVIMRRSELFDVQAGSDATGLRPIDPTTDVFGGRRFEDAVAALEYVGPWKLDLDVSRYELYDLKRSSISRSLIQAVWLRNDSLSVRAMYRLKSVNQRLVILMPPGFNPETGFDSSPVRVDGQTISLERGSGGELILPLGNRDRDREMLVEIRYTMPIQNSEIAVPTFQADCAVQKTELVVYLPNDWAPLNFGGPWSDKHDVVGTSFAERFLSPNRNAADLNWIATTDVPTARMMEFETDGRPFAFSTINPAPGSDGALRVTKVRSWLLSGLGAVLVAGFGLLFVRRSWNQRLIMIAVGLGLFVVAAMFWPFAVTYLDYEGVALASLIVLGVWVGLDVLVFLGQVRRRMNERPNEPTGLSTAASGTTTATSTETGARDE